MAERSCRQVGEVLYEVDTSGYDGTRVPVRFFADPVLADQIRRDRSLEQLCNVATLPGITRQAIGMPDMHEGYGFPVGGVAGTVLPDGVISPGGIGFDINCGVRLLASKLEASALRPELATLVHELSRSIPSGFGRHARMSFAPRELDRVLEEGSRYLVGDRGFGSKEDLDHTEAGGSLGAARADAVSSKARERGKDQLGTLGGGNHFLEIQEVEQIFDPAGARALGLYAGQVTVLIHTGSRGLGHQVCTDYVRIMDGAMARQGISVPDRQLACAPFSSREGQDYFAAMCAAANFAWANRQLLSHRVREVFARVLRGATESRLDLVYDVAHNIAKVETYDGRKVCVHRKGATRALGPRSDELPPAFRGVGQPVFIPGSMGTASYVLLGTDVARDVSWSSTCHGAGRALSRSAARLQVQGSALRKELEGRGIVVHCPSSAELAEEAPVAYKDVDRVVSVVVQAKIAVRVARLRPIGVLKG